MPDEFVEGTVLKVIWDKAIMPIREMEQELKVLLAKYGLEWYASGSDLVKYTRGLAFKVPVKKVHHVAIRWTGLAHMDLERGLEILLAAFGYTCTDRGRKAEDEDFELVFQQPE